jgi:hypothetical protein
MRFWVILGKPWHAKDILLWVDFLGCASPLCLQEHAISKINRFQVSLLYWSQNPRLVVGGSNFNCTVHIHHGMKVHIIPNMSPNSRPRRSHPQAAAFVVAFCWCRI